MSYMEFVGKDIEQAAQKASKKLQVPLEKLKYDIISYGSTGIFGLVGAKKAKIRAKLPSPPPVPSPIEPPIDLPAAPPKAKNHLPTVLPLEEEKPDTPEMQAEIEAAVEQGRLVLRQIVDHITDSADISLDKTVEVVSYNVNGENAAILIGKRGQTLEAIQYLVEKVVNRSLNKRVRVQVDIEGYMETRRIHLKQLATKLAQKAKKTGKPTSAGQMNAHDRRIVHLALKNDSAVRTQSMGEGYYRKLVIFPKKNAQQKPTSP